MLLDGEGIIFLGDWNAYPAELNCPRALNNPKSNAFGVMLKNFIDINSIVEQDIVIGLGPTHSFSNSISKSYIDHVLTAGLVLPITECQIIENFEKQVILTQSQ